MCRSAAAANQHPRGYQHWSAKPKYLSSILGTYPSLTPVTGLHGGALTGNDRSHIADNILRVGLNDRCAAR